MTITSLQSVLDFLGVDNQYFIITAENDELILTSDIAGPRTISISDGTYDGDDLATELQTNMNADTTLTGSGTITFAVTYSTTTKKFTISAGAGHTIAFTLTGSDSAYTFGFDEDATAALTITSNNEIGDPTDIVSSVHSEIESRISNYCRRTFESTAYTLEKYSSKGYSTITLKNYPATIIDRVAIGTRSAINIKNTSTGTSASVSVNTTGLRLVKDGTADTTVDFETYTTIATVVAAVNLIGSGWTAAVQNSTYSSFKSTDLIPSSGKGCINGRYVYLDIPDEADYDIQVDLDRGQVIKLSGFPDCFQEIFIDYTAGYSSDTMPDDLQLAVKIWVEYIWEKRNNAVFGVAFYNIGANGATGLRTIFEEDPIPKEVKEIIDYYKAYKV